MTHVRELEGHTADVLCCEFHPTDALLASGTEGGILLLHDLRSHTPSARIQFGTDELPCIAFAASDPNIIYACGGTTTYCADIRQAAVLQSRSFNADEVNSISVSPNGRFLATADDAGDVKIIDVSTWQLFKSMRGAHENICSGGVFRPHHPWELLTGSLDASVKRWNFSQGRSLRHWRMEPAEEHSSSQAFNPPLVHSVAVACPHWARQLGKLVAVARGDGVVAVYDAEQPQQPPQHRKVTKRVLKGNTASLTHATHSTQTYACTQRPPVQRGKQARPNGRCQASTAEERRSRDASGPVSALGADHGGHRFSVGCVRFHRASHGRLLLSGGNDARVLLWAWADRVCDPQWQDLFSQSTVENSLAPTAISNDGRNINCVDSMDAAGFNTAIADTSPVVKLHNVL